MAEDSGERKHGRERGLLFGVIALLAAALLLSEGGRLLLARKTSSMEGEIATIKADAESALSAVIAPETIEDAQRSVYLVTQQSGRGYKIATAFVIDRERGVLATAAHVVNDLDLDDREHPVAIINSFTGKPLPVLAARMHSGYRAFAAIVDEYAPIMPESPISRPSPILPSTAPFDVAVILVDPHDPDTGENLLGPSLPIASEDALRQVAAGDVIAILGFPGDSLGATDAPKGFEARAERGVVAAVTPPIDTATMAHSPETNYLIIHRMQLIGGNSGGPALNRAGEVIGVNTMVSTRDSVAQRADMLYDLLEPLREEDRLTRLYKPDIRARLAQFPRARDVLPYAFHARYSNALARARDAGPKTIADLVVLENPPFQTSLEDKSLEPAERQFVLLAPDLEDSRSEGDVAVRESNSAQLGGGLTALKREAFVIDAYGQFSAQTLYLRRSMNHVIFAIDFAAGVPPSAPGVFGACPLQLFVRRFGSRKMVGLPPAAIASYFVAADGPGVAGLDIVVRRSGCFDSDNRYLFGIVSWSDPDIPAKSTAVAVGGRDDENAFPAMAAFGDAARNAFNCWSPAFADRAACVTRLSATQVGEPG